MARNPMPLQDRLTSAQRFATWLLARSALRNRVDEFNLLANKSVPTGKSRHRRSVPEYVEIARSEHRRDEAGGRQLGRAMISIGEPGGSEGECPPLASDSGEETSAEIESATTLLVDTTLPRTQKIETPLGESSSETSDTVVSSRRDVDSVAEVVDFPSGEIDQPVERHVQPPSVDTFSLRPREADDAEAPAIPTRSFEPLSERDGVGDVKKGEVLPESEVRPTNDQSAGERVENLPGTSSSDRSPAAWLARLQRAAQRDAGLAPENVRAAGAMDPQQRSVQHGEEGTLNQPTDSAGRRERKVPGARVGRATRRFLTPIVGIDPGNVPTHRGVVVSKVLTEAGADAFAGGGEIYLGTDPNTSQRETLGLHAHELFHVARQRHPRFIPPLFQASASRTPSSESLALEVESAVRRIVDRRRNPTLPPRERLSNLDDVPGEAARPPSGGLHHVVPAPARIGPADQEGSDQATQLVDRWGGLPAPWEPITSWNLPQVETVGPDSPVSAGSVHGSNSSPQLDAASGAEAAASDRRLLESRIPAGNSTGQGNAPGNPSPQVSAQELDRLARQVYGVMRRRLATEQRIRGQR